MGFLTLRTLMHGTSLWSLWLGFVVALAWPALVTAQGDKDAGLSRPSVGHKQLALRFPSAAAWRTPDSDGDGRFEVLEVDVNVDVLVDGSYAVEGSLESKNGRLVANLPRFQFTRSTHANISGPAGRTVITLSFSGEQIRDAGLDGPYNLVLQVFSDTGIAGPTTLVTPALRWADFGERKGKIVGAMAVRPVDADGSGKFERVRVSFRAEVIMAGPFYLVVSLLGKGDRSSYHTEKLVLRKGVQSVVIDMPATGIARTGVDGPYEVTIKLQDLKNNSVDSQQSVLAGLFASQFEGIVDVGSKPLAKTIDHNGNGLHDLLRVGIDLKVRATRAALVHATLQGSNGASVSAEVRATLHRGVTQRLNLDFAGPQIRSMKMDSPHKLNLSFRDPSTSAEFDAVQLTLSGAYPHKQFDAK